MAGLAGSKKFVRSQGSRNLELSHSLLVQSLFFCPHATPILRLVD